MSAILCHDQNNLFNSFLKMTFQIFWLTFLVAYGSTKSSGNNGRPKILKQNHQIADDGTYAFSFEADDGSYRYETRNIDNLVTGKYGYIDEFGEKKEVEYSSANARSLTLDKNLANIDTIPLKVQSYELEFDNPIYNFSLLSLGCKSKRRNKSYYYHSRWERGGALALHRWQRSEICPKCPF